MAGYITAQELMDASVDAGTLDAYANGNVGVPNINRDGEDVRNLQTLNAEVLQIATGAANLRTYLTKAAMDADTSQPVNTMAQVVQDPTVANNVFYVWTGSAWAVSQVQPLGRRDGLPYNGLITNGTSMNAVLTQGVYRGNASGGYLDLPFDFPVTSAFTLINVNESTVAESSRFVLQSLRQFTTPWNTWTRLVDRNQIGFYPWERDAVATYRGVSTATDLNTLTQAGEWIYSGSPSNRPVGAPASGFIENVAFGTFYIQRLRDQTNPLLVWERINRTSPVTIGAWSRLYSFDRGTLTSANDFNALTAQAADYVLTSTPTNGPQNGPTGGIYSTRIVGDWELGSLTATLDPSQEWRRRRRISTNELFPWYKVGPQVKGSYVFVGDSLTEFGDFPERIGSRLGIGVTRAGFGGCRMGEYTQVGPAQAYYDAMCMYRIADYIASGDFTPLIQAADDLFALTGDDNRAQALTLSQVNWSTTSGLVIAFGTNDFGGNLPLGADTDTMGSTFTGAINYIVDKVQTKYPSLRIVFFAPLWRSRFAVGDGKDADTNPNGIGVYLLDYVDATIRVAALNKIPVHDQYRNSGINKYNGATFLVDGLHPTSPAGYQRVADRGAAFLTAHV